MTYKKDKRKKEKIMEKINLLRLPEYHKAYSLGRQLLDNMCEFDSPYPTGVNRYPFVRKLHC